MDSDPDLLHHLQLGGEAVLRRVRHHPERLTSVDLAEDYAPVSAAIVGPQVDVADAGPEQDRAPYPAHYLQRPRPPYPTVVVLPGGPNRRQRLRLDVTSTTSPATGVGVVTCDEMRGATRL
jgi:hypothetical protein